MCKCIGAAIFVSVAAATSGCGAYRYHRTQVTVTDAGSEEPASGVSVATEYWADLPGIINMPRTDSAVTDENGQAILSIASWSGNRLWVGNRLFSVQSDMLRERNEPMEISSWRLQPDDQPLKVVLAPTPN